MVRAFPVIHSVDSLSLAERISRIAGEESRHPEILLQVKLREDPSKGGLSVNELEAAWDQLQALPGVTITGLMTMAPQAAPMDERRALFQECRALATRFGLPECSMGMSGDWREAADAGATWLRLGSCLFGARIASGQLSLTCRPLDETLSMDRNPDRRRSHSRILPSPSKRFSRCR